MRWPPASHHGGVKLACGALRKGNGVQQVMGVKIELRGFVCWQTSRPCTLELADKISDVLSWQDYTSLIGLACQSEGERMVERRKTLQVKLT